MRRWLRLGMQTRARKLVESASAWCDPQKCEASNPQPSNLPLWKPPGTFILIISGNFLKTSCIVVEKEERNIIDLFRSLGYLPQIFFPLTLVGASIKNLCLRAMFNSSRTRLRKEFATRRACMLIAAYIVTWSGSPLNAARSLWTHSNAKRSLAG